MEVWLTYQGERLRLPITPMYKIEAPQNNSTELLNEVGTVNIKGKKGLRSVTIESFFPSKEYDFLESSDVVLDPFYYDEKIRSWANSDGPIRLIITDTPHNFEALVDSYSSGEEDGTGDVYYSLSLSEYVRVVATIAEPPVYNREIKISDVKRFEGKAEVPMALATPTKYDTPWTMAKKLTGNGGNAKQLLKQNRVKKMTPGGALLL